MRSRLTIKPANSVSMRYWGRIVLGSVVRLNCRQGSAYKGEHGVCYEVYQTNINGELVEAYSFIFERGYCTSLLPDEIDKCLLITGRVSKSHEYRWFTYFSDVIKHWQEGGFDEAFKPTPMLKLAK